MKPLPLTILFLSLACNSLNAAAQTCSANIIADAPNSRYVMKTDGTVIDKKTGLVWMRCVLGYTWKNGICQSSGLSTSYSWKDALQKAESTTFAGLSDWRLPNKNELLSLVEHRCSDPAINNTAFPFPTFETWSSSPDASGSYPAWIVNFYSGHANNDSDGIKKDHYYVRLVRGGQ